MINCKISDYQKLEEIKNLLMGILTELPALYEGKKLNVEVPSSFYQNIIQKGLEKIEARESIDSVSAFIYTHISDLDREIELLRLKNQALHNDCTEAIELHESQIRKGWDFP